MDVIKRDWRDVRRASSYLGLSGFLRNRKKWVSRKTAEKELMKLNGFALHRDVRRKFKRRHVKVFFMNNTWSTDLKDISNVAEFNRGCNFIIICVDNYTKKGYAEL